MRLGLTAQAWGAVMSDIVDHEGIGDHSDIRLTGMYTAREAAAWLRLSNWKSIYEIAEKELPRCKVGPRRGRIRYLGADLLCYVRGIEPLDIGATMTELKSRLSKPHGHFQSTEHRSPMRIL